MTNTTTPADEHGRLRTADFAKRYRDVRAMSTTADDRVATALTGTTYIWHDYTRGIYVEESRR